MVDGGEENEEPRTHVETAGLVGRAELDTAWLGKCAGRSSRAILNLSRRVSIVSGVGVEDVEHSTAAVVLWL